MLLALPTNPFWDLTLFETHRVDKRIIWHQLYIYGFSKVEGGLTQSAFSHPSFVRENRELCLSLGRNRAGDRRKKHVGTTNEKEVTTGALEGSAATKSTSVSTSTTAFDDGSLTIPTSEYHALVGRPMGGFRLDNDLTSPSHHTRWESTIRGASASQQNHGTTLLRSSMAHLRQPHPSSIEHMMVPGGDHLAYARGYPHERGEDETMLLPYDGGRRWVPPTSSLSTGESNTNTADTRCGIRPSIDQKRPAFTGTGWPAAGSSNHNVSRPTYEDGTSPSQHHHDEWDLEPRPIEDMLARGFLDPSGRPM